jgi:hypothetical protein
MGDGEATVVIARPWWRALVGGKNGGAMDRRGCGFLGVVRNLCHLDTDVVTLAGVTLPS